MSDIVAEVHPDSDHEPGGIAEAFKSLFQKYPRPAVPAAAGRPAQPARPYTVPEIAKKIKANGGTTTANTMWYLLNGKVRNPRISTVLEIVAAFGAELNDFQSDAEAERQEQEEVLSELREAEVVDVVMAELGPEISLAVLTAAAQALKAKAGEAAVNGEGRRTTSV